jgi:non-homologous end joining protein Ku
MVASISAQDQIAALIADSMPEQILHFKFSDTIQQRIMSLVDKKKTNQLSSHENEELEKYLTYDLLIGLSKARAYKALHP